MNAKHLGLVVVASTAAMLSSCSDDDDGGKKTLTEPQEGSVTVQLDGGNGITFVQPTQIQMSGSAAYDDPGDTVTISLTLTNGSSTILHNLKGVFTNLSEGTITGDGGFPISASEGGLPPYVYFGPESLAPGGSATADVVVTGVTGVGTELTMDVDLVIHPWLILPGGDEGVVATDSSGTGESVFLAPLTEALGWNGDSWSRADAKSPNGRYVYYTLRNQPAIVTYDTVEMTFTLGDSLMGGTISHAGEKGSDVGFLDGLTPSPDGATLYTVLSHGVHTYPHGSGFPTPELIEVLKLRATDLAVLDRVTVWEVPDMPIEGGVLDVRGKHLSLNPDGTRGALTIINEGTVFLIDTTNMSIIDADTSTDGDQGFVASSIGARLAVPNADASLIYVAMNRIETNDGTLEVIDTSDGSTTTLSPPTLTANDNMPTFLEWGPDGRLYYGRSYDSTVPGLSIYDPVGDSWVEIDGDMTGITFRADVYYVYDDDAGTVRFFDYDDVEQNFLATGTPGLISDDEDFGHGIVLTDADA